MTDGNDLYNPLDKSHLAESIKRAIESNPVLPLPPAESFVGAGIYAIYYLGNHAAYAPISDESCTRPIYVGKAMPPGGRTGGMDPVMAKRTASLFNRLRQHATSIEQVDDLQLADFRCRYQLLDGVWIPLGEDYLIDLYKPLWNGKVLSGFGIHAPGVGRKDQKRSLWDEFHPGRTFAQNRSQAKKSRDEIAEDVARVLGNIELFEAADEAANEGEDADESDEGTA